MLNRGSGSHTPQGVGGVRSEQKSRHLGRSGGILARSKQARHQMITEAVFKTNSDLGKKHFEVAFSGSTSITVMLLGNRLVCANIGDSRAVISSLQNKSPRGKRWIVTPLSRDHKPNDEDERARIIANGGRVETFRGNLFYIYIYIYRFTYAPSRAI